MSKPGTARASKVETVAAARELVLGTTGLAGDVWKIVALYLFCIDPADSRLMECKLETQYLDWTHVRTHGFGITDAPDVAPSSVSADPKCLGRICLRFEPVGPTRADVSYPYVIHLEPNTRWRRLKNPTDLCLRYRFPDDDYQREARLVLDGIVHGRFGRSTLRIRTHNFSERLTVHFAPVAKIEWRQGRPLYVEPPYSRHLAIQGLDRQWKGHAESSANICLARIFLECDRLRLTPEENDPLNEFDPDFPAWEPETRTVLHSIILVLDSGPASDSLQ